MSKITITSTTDSPEAVLAAQGGAVEPKTEVVETPAADKAAENLEASESQDEEQLDGEEPDESTDDEKPKKKKGVQKRIDKLAKQREEARKEASYWKQVALEKEQSKPQETAPEAPAKTTSADNRPRADDFDTHEAYVEALADWKVEKRLSERDAKAKEASLKSEQETKLKTFLDRRESFAKEHDDFFERMSDIEKIPMSLTVNETLLESENGPKLLYELASDVEEYKRICALPALAAARELGKLEAKLSANSEPKTEIKTTKAPKPPALVRSGKADISSVPLEEMSYADYKKARESGRTA